MLQKYQSLGEPLTLRQLKEIKGGSAVRGSKHLWLCTFDPPIGSVYLCSSADPFILGCADEPCAGPGNPCSADQNECV